MKKTFKTLSLFVLLLGIILSSGVVLGQVLQEKTLDRPYEVRTTNFAAFPELLNLPTSQIHLFAFRAASAKWEAIPFQIDEMDGDVQPNYFAAHNGLIDGNDELSYVVKDAGDKVTMGNWIDDEESKTYFRYEIEIYDTTVANRGEVAWIYIYRSSTLIPNNFNPYMDYDVNDDRIKSLFYEVDYNSKGILDYFSVSSLGGGTGVDILDRQKFFCGFIIPPNLDGNLNEDKIRPTEIMSTKGAIRVIHKSLNALFATSETKPDMDSLTILSRFYPHYMYISGKIDFTKFKQLNIYEIRQTWDFSENAIGMNFHSNKNQNIIVDGVIDNAVQDSLDHNRLNWMMVTGNPGTVLAVNDFSFVGSSQRLYYKDNSKINSNDTGDKKSYGEMGIKITGEKIADTLTYKSNIFFLPGNQDASLGDKILKDFATPVTEALSKQNFLTNVKSEESNTRPKEFVLGQNFPNPFNPETVIDFQVPKAAFVKIRILNILGQNIKTLVSQNFEAGRYQFTWNGKNDLGQKVGSGIYFYLMESENFRDLKKMILAD